MYTKFIGKKVVDCFFGKGWDQVVRFDVLNNKVMWTTFDLTGNDIGMIRGMLKKKGML